MAKIDDGGPAYPGKTAKYLGPSGGTEITTHRGMSLRDWFAGMAICGVGDTHIEKYNSTEYVANVAYEIADAMLAKGSESPRPPPPSCRRTELLQYGQENRQVQL